MKKFFRGGGSRTEDSLKERLNLHIYWSKQLLGKRMDSTKTVIDKKWEMKFVENVISILGI